jgi:hypothetical protein
MCHAASILAGMAAAFGLDAAGFPTQLSVLPSAKSDKTRCIGAQIIHLEGGESISLAHAEQSRATSSNLSRNYGEHSVCAAHRIPHAHPPTPLPLPLPLPESITFQNSQALPLKIIKR